MTDISKEIEPKAKYYSSNIFYFPTCDNFTLNIPLIILILIDAMQFLMKLFTDLNPLFIIINHPS